MAESTTAGSGIVEEITGGFVQVRSLPSRIQLTSHQFQRDESRAGRWLIPCLWQGRDLYLSVNDQLKEKMERLFTGSIPPTILISQNDVQVV